MAERGPAALRFTAAMPGKTFQPLERVWRSVVAQSPVRPRMGRINAKRLGSGERETTPPFPNFFTDQPVGRFSVKPSGSW